MAREALTSLVVGDDPLARRVAAEALVSYGHRVSTAGGAPEALDLLREPVVDLVVIDGQTPHMDGLMLTERIRSMPHGGPGVILVIGAGPSMGSRALEAGCDDFLVKPIHPGELGLRAERVIHGRRRGREPLQGRRRTVNERAARRDAEHATDLTIARLPNALREQGDPSGLYEPLPGSAPGGVYDLDLAGRITFVNDAARSMLGFTSEEAIGSSLHELVHDKRPDGSPHPEDECPLHATIDRGEPHEGTETFFRRDGSGLPIRYNSTPARVDGRVTGAVLVFFDATDRVAVTREKNGRLQPGQEPPEIQSRPLQEQPEALETQNQHLKEQQASLAERTELLERQRGELQQLYDQAAEERARMSNLYEAARSLVAGNDDPSELADATLARLVESARADVGALYLRDSDGEPPALVAVRGLERERLDSIVSPNAGLAGRALAERSIVEARHPDTGLRISSFGCRVALRRELHAPLRIGDDVIGVATFGWTDDAALDDDARRALEALVAQAASGLSRTISERATRDREAIISAVLDATPDAIQLEDPEGRVRIANASARDFFAGLDHEVVGSSGGRLRDALTELVTDPDTYRRANDALEKAPHQQHLDTFELTTDGRVLRRYVAPVRGDDNELLGRIVVMHDMTEARRAERMRDEIVATVSHELRTPLTSIIGYTELIEEEASEHLTEDEQHMLSVVDRNARRLLALVGDLLVVAQSEAHALDLSRSETDVAAVVAACIEDARPVAVERGILLIGDDLASAEVLADGDRLGQAVANLIGNALKFTPGGGTVRVELSADDHTATIEVVDDGPGIAPDEAAHVFDRFFRGQGAAADEAPGSGLGLSVTKAIVDGHGGTVGIDSEIGRGTRMIVRLPLHRPAMVLRQGGGAP